MTTGPDSGGAPSGRKADEPPADGAGPAEAEDVPAQEEDELSPLSLRAQLTIWFSLSFGVILATILTALILIDGGRVFDGEYEHYDWMIRVTLGATFAALVGGVAAAWVIVGAAVEPLRRITESARDVAPERIEESRIAVPEVGTEVNAAKRELNRALDRIEAGYQAQERFISNVSHELKTPIAVVLTEARRLRRMERPQAELEEFIDDIAEQMAHLAKVVESFLTLARIDYEERLQKNEEFWFHDLLVEAVSRSTALALTHDVHLELELEEDFEFFDAPTWGDPELVSSAVENLIRNAIRFSTRGGLIHVSVTGATAAEKAKGPEARPRAVIRVMDQGPGMPADILETVFQPF
ncbi:MAG: HAMP domain-containing sensor histidine kinase, partial [Planctomycetota bacterium]|nr:HAMP domain-containing sensor histidine kinase [Planctomycetota bacterium]